MSWQRAACRQRAGREPPESSIPRLAKETPPLRGGNGGGEWPRSDRPTALGRETASVCLGVALSNSQKGLASHAGMANAAARSHARAHNSLNAASTNKS